MSGVSFVIIRVPYKTSAVGIQQYLDRLRPFPEGANSPRIISRELSRARPGVAKKCKFLSINI